MWKVLPGLEDAPTDVEFGPGQVVAVASWDSKVTLVDCAAGRVRTSLTLRAPALDLAWGKTIKTHLYLGGAEQHLSVFDAETGRIWDFGGDHASAVSAVCAGDNLVLSGGYDGSLQIADPRSPQGVFYPHPKKICSMALDGNLLVVGMLAHECAIFDVRRLSVPIVTKELQFRQPVRRVAIKHETVAVSSVNSRVSIDQIDRARSDFSFRCHRTPQNSYAVNGLEFTPNGALVTGGADRTVHLWSVQNQRHTAELPRLPAPVHDLSVSKDGQLLVATVCDDAFTRGGEAPRAGQMLVTQL